MKKAESVYEAPTKVRRRGHPYPRNVRKKLGPKSSWRTCKKKYRGQG
jgi:hypothetical protein